MHRALVLGDVSPRIAPEGVAARVRLTLAKLVLLPGMPGRMEAVTVQLDSQLVRRPAAIDVTAVDATVRVGERKAVPLQEAVEALFHRAEQERRVTTNDSAKGRRSLRARSP